MRAVSRMGEGVFGVKLQVSWIPRIKGENAEQMDTTPKNIHKPLLWGGVASFAFIFGLSIYLGIHRIFQVDEVLYSSLARFMATGKMAQFVPNVPIILVGPLTWIAGAAKDGVGVLIAMRLPFVALMWVNAFLMVKATGQRLRSRGGVVTLFLASTLAPMWDYGFEIRHDVPLVTVTLALWCLLKTEKPGFPLRMLLGGVLAACMQLIAFKGFLYALPMLGLGIYMVRPKNLKTWFTCLSMILVGIAGGLLLGRLIHGVVGTWDLAWKGFQAGTAFAANGVERFSPWSTLLRGFTEAPLLACAGVGVLLAPFFQPSVRTIRVLVEADWFPEWAFAVLCFALLLINPTPFPYNLIHVVPAFFIAVLRFREPILEAILSLASPVRQAVLGCLLLLHGLTWSIATARHLNMDNDRQVDVIRTSEKLTDPSLHRVFDGSGLVPTRSPIGEKWIIHSFTIRHYMDGSWPTVRSLLAKNPTPVILPNYRTNWLPKEDQAFIGTHYVFLAEDFMVLGTIRGSGSSSWEVLADGRYMMTVLPEGAETGKAIEIDGRRIDPGICSFTRGVHSLQVPEGFRIQIVWLGPHLQTIPALGPAPHPLFVNWY